MSRHRTTRLLLALPVVVGLACAPPPQQRWRALQQEPTVRVGLLVKGVDAQLELSGDFELRVAGEEPQLLRSGSLRLATMQGTVTLGTEAGREYGGSSLSLRPRLRESRFRLGEHWYRGDLRMMAQDGRLTLINALPLETYLRGVVPWEIGWRPAAELGAVEAQAIAARTYACKRLGQYEDAGFDLLPDVMDQVYRGTTREDSVANQAIRATRGVVVLCDDALIEAYYSSTCGGHTSRIEEVWDKPAAVYLVGGIDRITGGTSALCAASKHFRWTEAWSGADLEATLQETLPVELGWPPERPVGGLRDVRIVGRDSSGRVRTLEVVTTEGTSSVHGDRIRWVLRPADRAILRSTLFEMQVERENGAIVRLVVRGGGNGHGVGMCQMGALEMARLGSTPERILAHYYPGTMLSSLY